MEDCIVTKIQSKIKRNTRKKRITLTFSSDGDPRDTDANLITTCLKIVSYGNIAILFFITTANLKIISN